MEEWFKAGICVVVFRRERHFLWEAVRALVAIGICVLLVGAALPDASGMGVWASLEAVICASQWQAYLFHEGGKLTEQETG